MMKVLLLMVMLTTMTQYCSGQTATAVCLVYVEASATSRLALLKSRVQEVVDAHPSQKIILYISNGDFPVVMNGEGGLENALNQLDFIRPPHPDCYQDVDSMNSLLSIAIRTQTLRTIDGDQVNVPVSFCFFLNARQAEMYQEDKIIVDQLLRSNRLMPGKGKLWQVHNAAIYLDTAGQPGIGAYWSQLQQQKRYEVNAY